ncbi:MAG: hypothetical protein GF368_02080 [Candidatus Aenigmarchaeota archaeon]|nr:hypothetical protein [Candidatus Aenigmarchaeota archaeon]
MLKLPKLKIDRDGIRKIEKSKKLEWIVTNGTGCYSSSTITGMNTRKYHGLLIASKKPPLDRKVILSKLEEELILEDKRVQLSTNQYVDTIYPKGYEYLEKFELNGNPEFFYKAFGIKIRKEIFMLREKNVAVVSYEVDSGNKKIKLRLKPLINHRSIYHVRKNKDLFETENKEKGVKINFGKDDFLRIFTTKGKYCPSTLKEEQKWYKNFYYEMEIQRGEDGIDNCYNPGVFEVEGKGKFEFKIIASYCDDKDYDYDKMRKKDIKRKEKILSDFFKRNKTKEEDWVKWLILASDNHLIKRYDGKYSIIAGYHWFGEWSRDTMISLPGICLKTGRLDEAKKILEGYSKHVKNGLLPNTFPVSENDKPNYNSVDATLWFVNCIYLYYQETKDKKFIKKIWPIIISIIEKHVEGTNGVKLDDDFLLKHGPGMTWMDVKLNGEYVTPRSGKAVEIQALWYNCLCVAEFFAKELGKDYRKYQFHDNMAKKNFNEKFWSNGYLKDTLDDNTLRPNQLIALDLPFKIIDDDKKIIKRVKDTLGTDYGLRTLPKDNGNYSGTYSGDVGQRDRAYHQGTIWPWISTLVENNKKWLKKFVKRETNDFGLGTICEIIDGDEPHEGRGCISQAWSIGKLLEGI